MENLSVYFLLNDDGFELIFSPANEEVWNVYIEFMSIFGSFEELNLTVKPAQVASTELKEKLWGFVDKYKKQIPPLNKLKSKIASLESDEYFLILPNKPDDTQNKLDLEIYLQSLNSADNASEAQSIFSKKRAEISDHFAELLKEYNVVNTRNDRKTYIGESARSKRICRFCKKSENDGATFKKVAHAISEGLGNKNIILREECDSCNEYFGSVIEPTLVESLDIVRVFFGVRGKRGIPSIEKYKDSKIFREEEKSVIQAPEVKKVSDKEITVTLVSQKKYIPVNIYKALCKIALSVVDGKEIGALEDTISWMRFNDDRGDTPKVAVNLDRGPTITFPSITLFVRKTENYNIPHIVGEFRAAGFIYVFIVPFSRKDKISFIKEEDFNRFWKFFPQYGASGSWRLDNYNNCNEIELTEKIRFIQADKSEA